ncbi:unnamed protein product [Thelazia callipaeda]|uniref:Biogenesis of lysosome-related organelles complex 1 subunit 5 n=1 Tax=Thelazia callipaeda TaxID=103827 RepID=A0A0N5CUH4_THECL|nr:unnamed protein product [Thelazia callipaeda]
MTSISTVVENVQLVGEQIFDHIDLIRKETNKFLDNFERNERHKEFDGIIRASHSLVEAANSPLQIVLAKDDLRRLNDQIKKTTAALSQSMLVSYQKEHDDYLEAIRNNQKQQKEIVESAIKLQQQALKLGNVNSDDILTSPDISNTIEVDLN